MAKEESFFDSLLKLGAIIGGGILLLAILRSVSPYKCPYCGAKVVYGEKKCAHCNSQLNWVC